jgi:hypothetical protein
MISASTGAMALVMVTLVKDHGVEYLFAATVSKIPDLMCQTGDFFFMSS